MFFVDLVWVLIIALVLGAILAAVFGRPGWGGFILLFLILFFATWAGGLWVTPIGHPLLGVSWLSFLLVGVFVALILAAFMPRGRNRRPAAAQGTERPGDESIIAANVFFWVLISLLALTIVIGYLVRAA